MSQAPTNGMRPTPSPQRFIPRLLQRTGPLTESIALSPSDFSPRLLPQQIQGDRSTASVCGFCSTGCNLNVHQRGEEAIGLSPATDYPVNLGMACPKGWEALAVLDAPDRATRPLLRSAAGKLEPVSWDVAATTFVERIQAIQREHGPQSVAFLSTGQIGTEEMALLGSLAKFGMGMLHGDGNTRQCMATAVVAYKQAFGFDAPPYTYADFEQSDTIVLVGSNLCIAHPILWQRVMRNQFDPQIIAIDPRTTETTMSATQHLALQPKSDLTLFYGVANLLIEREWIDREFIDAHTSGFDEFMAFVRNFPLPRVVEETGLAAETIERFAETIHNGLRVSFWWTMGVNQSHQAVRTAQAIINLALLTGNIGRPGTGANSITGQCNAMGSRLFSNTTNLLGGHDFASPEHRQKVAGILAIDESRIPHEASWPYHRIMEGILRHEIRGLWVVATNPAHSWINQETARDILSRLDFLVVQDMYHSTETARIADLVLPAAGWGEKEGTFINSERRIGVTSKVARAPGEALADFHIFKLLAEYWGCGEMFRRWESPAATFEILKQLSAGQPCDVTGIEGYEMLRERGGVQWPYAAEGEQEASERRLFADGQFFHPDGRAKFLCEEPRPLPEPTTSKFPFTLLTGRGSVAQWHTQTRTAKSAVLRKLYPAELYVEINPHDAAEQRLRSGDLVTITSQRGSIQGRAMVTPAVQPGQLFVPMHYEATNRLTHPAFDPYSHQPSYKACAVRVEAASH
jgi:anaerobic selenocysteine-containing dehydrogenase